MRCFSEDDVQKSKKSWLQGQSPKKSRKEGNLVHVNYGGQRTGPAYGAGERRGGGRVSGAEERRYTEGMRRALFLPIGS
jgi:hypothetical protein